MVSVVIATPPLHAISGDSPAPIEMESEDETSPSRAKVTASISAILPGTVSDCPFGCFSQQAKAREARAAEKNKEKERERERAKKMAKDHESPKQQTVTYPSIVWDGQMRKSTLPRMF